MNILFLSSNRGQICGLNLKKPLHLLVMTVMLGLMVSGSVYVGYTLNPSQDNQALIDEWQADVHRQQVQLKHIRQEADANIDALSSRIGLLQAHVMRLDALGRKLVRMASIDKAEFDFDLTPALGGPETISNMGLEPDELSQAIEQLSFELENRENQLAVLENLVLDENLQKEIQPSGRVVTYAGKRYGYGNVIDIAHGNGYTTRYAHNSRLLVSVGDTVEKGFQIAEIGSSGRSTGPHVHFEVLKNGREINPVRFIRAAN